MTLWYFCTLQKNVGNDFFAYKEKKGAAIAIISVHLVAFTHAIEYLLRWFFFSQLNKFGIDLNVNFDIMDISFIDIFVYTLQVWFWPFFK